jgi:ABC-2 type transport system ATP-binding protein
MIEVSGLTKFYGQICAINDLSFQIERGQIAGFLGLNGAGKSTALKILAGSLLPTAGQVKVDGTDAVAEPEKLRAQIGFLPEDPPLYREMTVVAFLRYLARLRGFEESAIVARVDEVMDKVGIKERAQQRIDTLSLGFKKRLGIAQAIVHDPQLVILDEPISGLDPMQIVQMRELIATLRGDHTVLISSHILTEVQETCDHLILLKDGGLVAQGSEQEIQGRFAKSRAIELTLRGEGQAAATFLSELDEVEKAELLTEDDNTCTLRLQLGGDDREAVAAALVGAGWGIRRLDGADNDLEAAFMAVVGGGEAP